MAQWLPTLEDEDFLKPKKPVGILAPATAAAPKPAVAPQGLSQLSSIPTTPPRTSLVQPGGMTMDMGVKMAGSLAQALDPRGFGGRLGTQLVDMADTSMKDKKEADRLNEGIAREDSRFNTARANTVADLAAQYTNQENLLGTRLKSDDARQERLITAEDKRASARDAIMSAENTSQAAYRTSQAEYTKAQADALAAKQALVKEALDPKTTPDRLSVINKALTIDQQPTTANRDRTVLIPPLQGFPGMPGTPAAVANLDDGTRQDLVTISPQGLTTPKPKYTEAQINAARKMYANDPVKLKQLEDEIKGL